MLSDRIGVDHASVHPVGQRTLADVTLAEFATRWIMQVADVAQIGRYDADNAAIRAQAMSSRRIVFLGDSITEFWGDLQRLAPGGPQLINRGIAGQGTVQMLLRFQEDVVSLKPDTLILTAGTNDLRAFVGDAHGAGQAAIVRIMRNIASMTDIARAHGLAVVIGAVTPVRDLPGSSQTSVRDPACIRDLNVRLAEFAERSGFHLLDYHAVLVGEDGLMRSSFTDDGLHPNAEGYARMEAVLSASGLLVV